MKTRVGVSISRFFKRLLLAVASLLAAPVFAAPLDALLDARPARNYLYGFIELGGDFVNDTVDVLGVRDEKDAANGVGDYTGGHLRLGWQLTDRLWLEGSAWQRQVTYGPDKPKVESYSVAAQYRLVDQPQIGSWQPDVALRAGYWTNQTKKFRKSTPSNINVNLGGSVTNVTIDTAEIRDAEDSQQQIDLIFSWKFRPNLSASFFAGLGKGEVTIGGITATQAIVSNIQNIGGCSGSVKLGGVDITVDNAISVDGEVCHKHSYQQVGANLQWLPWDALTLRAGYVYQSIDREQIDDLVKQYGGKPITEGHTLIGEAAYRFAKFGQVFVRGQLMSGPFLGEIPFLYNRITAPRFDKEYGFVTVGLILDF